MAALALGSFAEKDVAVMEGIRPLLCLEMQSVVHVAQNLVVLLDSTFHWHYTGRSIAAHSAHLALAGVVHSALVVPQLQHSALAFRSEYSCRECLKLRIAPQSH